MHYLKGKVLLITGSSGIAAETIKLAVGQQAKVFYASIDEASCKQLQQEIGRQGDVDYFVGDLTLPETAQALVSHCMDRYEKIDALFNVAGISGRKYGDGPLHECTEEGWSITLETNLTTQYRMCREVIHQMLKAERDEYGLRGSILNISSILGILSEPIHFATAAYATSKGAILTMTKNIAAYYAKQGIRANAIAPGLVATKMSARASTDPEIRSFIKERQPLTGKMMNAQDIAESAIFLLSNQSRVITGQTLMVDAGWSTV